MALDGWVLLPWHWVVAGLVLAAMEIAVPSFTLLWLGVAALLTGGLLALIPDLSPSGQLLFWSLCSVLLAGAWFFWLNPRIRNKTTSGMAREALLGSIGHVLTPPHNGMSGQVRFTVPLLGQEEWPMRCTEPLEAGTRVRVIEIYGNTLQVEKMRPDSSS